MRPDPHRTPRRPQAVALPAVAYRPATAAPSAPFAADGRLDWGALTRLLDEAEVAAEGHEAGASVRWRLLVPMAHVADLERALCEDGRARRLLEGAAWRELARLLTVDLPIDMTLHLRAAGGGAELRVTAEFAPALARRLR